MKITVALILLLFVCSCSSKKSSKNEPSDSIKTTLHEKVKNKIANPINANLVDTTINGVTLKFQVLNKAKYDSFKRLAVKTEIPNEAYDGLVVRKDSSQLVRLNNDKYDTLRSFSKGTGKYFESFQILKYWKGKNQLLVNFSNWEDSDDFLLNTMDGMHYYLASAYELSPNRNHIISYTRANLLALYSPEFMLTKVASTSAETVFRLDFGKAVVTDFVWLTNSSGVLTTGELGKNLEISSESYFLLKTNLN